MSKVITVRGLGSNMYRTAEYVIFLLFLPGKYRITGRKVTAMTAPREVYVVDNLKTKMLIEMDIIIPEKMDVILSTSLIYIGSC